MNLQKLLLCTIFFIAPSSLSSLETNVTFAPATTNPGLIFEQQKNIIMAHDEWKLVYFYDLTKFYGETQKMKAIQSTMKKICEELAHARTYETKHICTLTINQLKIHLDHMETRDNIVQSFETHNNRNRRAPVEIVGTAAKYLFGILDAESAEKYDNDINDLKSDTGHINEIISQQTTLIEGIIVEQDSTIAEIQSNLISVNEFLRDIENKTNNQLTTLNSITQFNALATTITLALIHHDDLSNRVFNLLTNTLHGKITDVIPLSQMKENIRGISKHLNTNSILPINIETESIYHIFKYTIIKSTLHKKKIIIELSLPAVNHGYSTVQQ